MKRNLTSPGGLVSKVLLLLLGGLLLCACAPRAGALPASPGPDDLDRKIGQMLLVGFRGLTAGEDHFIVRDLRERHLGGVILFDYDHLTRSPVRNVESPSQVRSLVASLKAAAGGPLLVAVDQEGGRVARLKERHGFPPSVSHGDLGKRDDLDATREASARIAAALKETGINFNMAPVVDLCVHPDNPVIARYERCFSADPETAAAHALRFVEGHRRLGVLTTLKHFPGHGSSSTDSHLGFTDVTETWSRAELVPYIRLLDSGAVDAVMTAHVFNARLDPQYPATLSRAVVTGLLREELGYDGVVVSDDLQMGAIAGHFGFETAIRKAIEAGVDILVFGNNLQYDETIVPRAVAAIRRLVEQGVVSAERIDASFRRIQRLKGRLH